MLWLRWATEWWKAYKSKHAVKKGTGEDWPNPSDGKVSLSQEWNSNFLGVKSQNVLTSLWFKPVLYIEILGMVICPITSPRFVEANEFRVNFLNGY